MGFHYYWTIFCLFADGSWSCGMADGLSPSQSDPSLSGKLRRSRSLRSTHFLRTSSHSPRGPETEMPRSESMGGTLDRPKKKRTNLKQRLSVSFRGQDRAAFEEAIKNAGEPTLPESGSLISIGDNVSFSHKEHVGKDDANHFLLRLLKLREERYMEIHQKIRESYTAGYVDIRPPIHMVSAFEKISPVSSIRRRSSVSSSWA
jgi:hypothetical protein